MRVDSNYSYLQQTGQKKTNKSQNQNQFQTQQPSFQMNTLKTDTFTKTGGMDSINRLMNEVSDSDVQNNQEQNAGSNFMDSIKNMMTNLFSANNESSGSEESTESTSETSGAKGSPPSGGSSIPESLQTFLSSLGLSSSGSKEGDYSLVMNHLSSMESSDPGQKENVTSLRSNFTSLYSSL